MNKKGLGKGLQALLPDLKEEKDLLELAVDQLTPNPFQPRTLFSAESIEELAASIDEYGFIQPIIVVKRAADYQIVAGERRWRAAKHLKMTKIPVLVKEYSDRELMEIALIENLQREDLNQIDIAVCYEKLIEEFALTQEELGKRIGKSRTAITNTLRLLKLPEEIKDYVSCGTISGGHAKAILGLKEAENQIRLARKVVDEDLSVRQTEELVQHWTQEKEKKPAKSKDMLLLEMEDKLRCFFGTKVAINQGKKKGKIEIEYYSEEDLERIITSLLVTDQ